MYSQSDFHLVRRPPPHSVGPTSCLSRVFHKTRHCLRVKYNFLSIYQFVCNAATTSTTGDLVDQPDQTINCCCCWLGPTHLAGTCTTCYTLCIIRICIVWIGPPTIHCFDGMGTSNASIPKVPLSLAVDGTKTYRSCPIISLQVATTITKSPLKEKQEHS